MKTGKAIEQIATRAIDIKTKPSKKARKQMRKARAAETQVLKQFVARRESEWPIIKRESSNA